MLTAAERVAADMLRDRIGLRVDDSTRRRLSRVVRDAAAAAGRSELEWAQLLRTSETELQRLIDHVTVQETAFFRHPEQFDVLARRILEPGALPGEGVVWSAGCAHGEEAWSLAMLLEELGLPGWTVLGTEVSPDALERAREGHYSERELKGLSADRRARFLRASGDSFEVADALRRRVRFLPHNLVVAEPPAEAGDCRIVFCRNVLIYLTRSAVTRFLTALHSRMPHDGLLFVGAAESLAPDEPTFMAERVGEAYVYRPRPPGEAPVPAPRAPRRPAAQRRATPARSQQRSAAPLPSSGALIADGQRLAAAGRPADAAGRFRQAVYLEPEDALAHLHLAIALIAAGDPGASRALRAARAALVRADREQLAEALKGWSVEEVERFIAGKLEEVA